MKKKHPPKDFHLPRGIESFTTGTGFTKQVDYRIKGPFRPEHLTLIEKLYNRTNKQSNAFESVVAPIEVTARQILTQAGLPSEPRWVYTIPEGERFFGPVPDEYSGTLIDVVSARGYRMRVDLVWYAAQILDHAQWIREITTSQYDIAWAPPYLMKLGDEDKHWTALFLAVKLGEMVGEAKAIGFFIESGAEGPRKRRRRIVPFRDLARYLIQKNREGTARDLWKMIPTDEFDCIRIKGHKFFRRGERIIALGKVEGYKDPRPVGRPLQFDAFKKRVGKVRKFPAR